jgi:cytochrome c oxidase subunit 3
MAVADTAALDEYPASEHHKPGGISTSLLGMVLFIASEVMFFGGLFGAYFTIRSAATTWPPEGAGSAELETWYAAILTTVLVSSSVTMQFGVWAIRRNDQRKLMLWLAASLLLGLGFLSGQAYEYSKLIGEGMTLSSGVFGSTFFTLTGFHGAHVAGGAAFILIVLLRARSGQFTARYHDTVEMASYYWHFVDVVWLGLFSTIYLLR